ncbi:MAG: polyketide cyclase [Bacillota bacterium]
MKRYTISAIFKSDINRVWNIVTDNTFFKWRSDLEEIKVIDDNIFVEISNGGYKTEFEITDKEPLKYYSFKIKGQNTSGQWHGKFSVYQNGTKIEFTEEITPKNPIMNLFLGLYIKKQQSLYISDLRKALGE